MSFLQILLYCTEVWALLIPLLVIAINKPVGKELRFVIWYVILGFILNFIAILMLFFHYLVPEWMHINGMVNNNILYFMNEI